MEAKLVKINNSFYIIIPDFLVKQYALSGTVVLEVTENGLLIKKKPEPDGGINSKQE